MNENLKIALALIAFLALVAGLEAMAGYAFFHALEAEDQQRVLAILTSRAELLLELGVLAWRSSVSPSASPISFTSRVR